MNNTQNNKIDRMLRQAIRQVTPETPKHDLVPSVMLKIEQMALKKRQAIKTEPLISWKGWLLISFIIIGMFVMIIKTGTPGLSYLNVGQYVDHFVSSYLSVFLSRFFVIGMAILTLFFIVQICLVVHKIERKYEV